MKLLLILFIAFTTPAVLFFATLIYTDVSNDKLKTTLAAAGVYEQISKHLTVRDTSIDDPFLPIIADRFTPEYLKTKTESTLDDATNWITGKSAKIPEVNFKELKEDLAKRDPKLLASLQNVPNEAEMAEAGIDEEQRTAYIQQVKQISDFTKQDFAIKLDQHLGGFKLVYDGLKIAIPIVILILLLSLFMVVKLSNGLPTKFKWLGITFIVTAFVGYGVFLSNSLIATGLEKVNLLEQSTITALITPIMLAVLNYFIKLYASYQQTAGVIFLVLAGICFLGAILTRKYAAVTIKPLKVKRSYWEKPLPKK